MEKAVEKRNPSKIADHSTGQTLGAGGSAQIAAEISRLEKEVQLASRKWRAALDPELEVTPDKELARRHDVPLWFISDMRWRMGLPKLRPVHRLVRLHKSGDLLLNEPNWTIRQEVECCDSTITLARKMVGLL